MDSHGLAWTHFDSLGLAFENGLTWTHFGLALENGLIFVADMMKCRLAISIHLYFLSLINHLVVLLVFREHGHGLHS